MAAYVPNVTYSPGGKSKVNATSDRNHKKILVTVGSGRIAKVRDESGRYVRERVAPEDKKARRADYARRYYARLREMLMQKYSSEEPYCNCCGEKHIEFLTIDHVKCDGAEDRKRFTNGTVSFYVHLLRVPVDKESYQVLCYNCNMYKRADRSKICPHQQD